MRDSCFADRLGDLTGLSVSERDALARLEQRERPLRRGAVLLRERERINDLFVLKHGMLMSYVLLDDGSRQILRFHFPGDLCATSALVYRESTETIAALSDAVVSPFDRAALSGIIADHPRLGALILAYSQVERVALTDRLAGLGRTAAKSRVAALLVEFAHHLGGLADSGGTSFVLGLTQEEIGDATGLTSVHVNRMLRQLEDEGTITREGGRMTLRDPATLTRAANFVERRNVIDLGWLPPAR